jgi:hypothetical protein
MASRIILHGGLYFFLVDHFASFFRDALQAAGVRSEKNLKRQTSGRNFDTSSSSGLYCRLRNFTKSHHAPRGLYHRSGIARRPEDPIYLPIQYHSLIPVSTCPEAAKIYISEQARFVCGEK